MSSQNRVVLAEIGKPRGIRGEVTARSLTDIPGRLEALRQAHLHLANGSDVAVEMEEAWEHKGDWVFKFAGVDSIEKAEPFKGAELWVPFEERAALPEGEFFESDLVGLPVMDVASGLTLGKVEDVQRYGGPPLLVLQYQGREVLIPFVPEICKVDLATQVIRAALPDGLLEL